MTPTTKAGQALLAEMHPCADRDHAHSTPGGTWHMSANRMASMLDAVVRQARAAAIAEVRREVEGLRDRLEVDLIALVAAWDDGRTDNVRLAAAITDPLMTALARLEAPHA